MGNETLLNTMLREQFGLIKRTQVLGAHMTDDQIRYRLATDRWEIVDPGVYRVVGAERSWRADLMQAHLATGGIVSHESAGLLWEIYDARDPKPLVLTVPYACNPTYVAVVLHRSTQFSMCTPTVLDGVPCTGLARTVLDLAAVLGWSELNHVVDAALRTKKIDWPDLYGVLVDHSRQGRNGCGKLRQILDVRYGDTSIPDSKWNRMFASLLTSRGLPDPEFEHEIFDEAGFIARVDLAYPRQRLAIELDSVRWHHNLDAFQADRDKRNRLQLAGWQVLAFTWADYRDRPETVVDSIRPFFE